MYIYDKSRFKIWPTGNLRCCQSKTLRQCFVQSLVNELNGSNMVTLGSIRFIVIGWKLAECLWSVTPFIFCYTTNFFASNGNKIHYLNPKCAKIPWVLSPKKSPIDNFGLRSVSPKNSLFSPFSVQQRKEKLRARVRSILMPPTFHIASLNRYTPKFSGVPHKLTWCHQFGLQVLPKSGDADF